MEPKQILFDGYCPESLLSGKKAEMRLNEDDFWESEATGLQMTVFPPFAAILRWRGKGKYRPSSGVASDCLSGLIMAEARLEEGKEIFPDEERPIQSNFDLRWYLDGVYRSHEEYCRDKFNPNDPVFELQQERLSTLTAGDLKKLAALYHQAKEGLDGKGFIYGNEVFGDFHKLLYELKLIFDFRWMSWHKGWNNINNQDFDYSNCTFLELSMYLTAIFRCDRFSDGTIEANMENGTIGKLMARLMEIARESK